MYDAAGRQTLRLDPRSFRTSYVYDALDRVTSRKYPDGSRATFVFDAVGNRTAIRDATGRYTYSYDAVNRLAQYQTQAHRNTVMVFLRCRLSHPTNSQAGQPWLPARGLLI